jgi:acetyl esterase/lipase
MNNPVKCFWLTLICSLWRVVLFSQNPNYVVQSNINYYVGQSAPKNDSLCTLDVYYPTHTNNFPTIIWLHGGGLSGGKKEIPDALKNCNMAVVGVDYRLAPLVSSPEYIRDAAAAVAWTFHHIAELGGDTSHVFLAGYSAGAFLATLIALDSVWLGAHGINSNRLAGVISLSGQMITHFQIRKESGVEELQPVIDELAPLYHIRSDAPSLYLITGDRELELMGRYEENAYMQRMMKLAGHKSTSLVELKGYSHNMTEPAFPLMIAEIQRLLDEKGNRNSLRK